MTDHVPINPCTIPQFTGDLAALESDRAKLDAAAGTFRDAGSNVDSEFQGLSAFYTAPEAAQLFATTKPVKTDSDFFADQLESAAKALGEYVTEARPIVARLKELQAKATTFTGKIAGDEHWKDDGDKIDENNDLIHDVNAAVSAFWAAERTCANKIRALYCAPPLTTDDGSHGANMYGYEGEDLNNAQDLPWGSQLEETHRAWEIGYWVKSFVWDGLIVDGVWGTIKGLGTLVGFGGLDAMGQAWTGLAKLATGLVITAIPGANVAFWMADDKDMPGWLKDSRTAMKETGKALVAWDEWGKNPARAAGAVTFNVLTTVFTGGAGAVAKTGSVAKVISAAGKAGRLIDPVTYIGKAGSLAKLKVGDLFANFGKVDGAFPKIDDVVWKDLPKAEAPGGVTFPHPDDTVRLLDDPLGRPQYYDRTTHQLLDHKGVPKQDLTSVPKGPDHPLAEVPVRQEVPVGVGAHTPGGAVSHTPGGVADNTVHNSHTDPTHPPAGHTDTTPTGGAGHGDGPSTGGGHDGPSGGGHDGPSTGGGHDGPATGGGHDGPATGGGHDGPATGGGHDGPGGGDHGNGPGGGGGHETPGGGGPEQSPVRLEGDKITQQPSGKMPAEREADVTEALSKSKVPPGDQARMVTQLRKSEYGAAVADHIASGKFADIPNYKELIFQVKQPGMMPAVHQALEHAAELQSKNIDHIAFELKIPERGLDLDVLTRTPDGRIEYGAQLKDVQSVKGIKSAVKGIAEKQLAGGGVDVKAAILDVHDVKGALTERDLATVQRAADRTNASFELRFNDGSITIYPTNAINP
ncbi:hypothetical protein [Streptomyces sp. NPDC058623]|uniref:hypothetical protein n=1 Tax=Streptomyces sp. NPDC058623 TaxID=3346563 RepID=UPI003668767D